MKPNLGTNWNEAIKSAYDLGWGRMDWGWNETREELSELEDDFIPDDLREDIDVSLHEGMEYDRFHWAIEDFYENHMSDEEYQQFQRELAVAEDIIMAYDAGAWDNLLGEEYNPEDLPFLLD